MRRAAPAAMLVLALAGCSTGARLDELEEEPPEAAAPALFTTFATPCPAIGGRAGTELDGSVATSIFRTVECGYGTAFPRLTSRSTINKPGSVRGAAEQVTGQMFADLRREAEAAGTVEERSGLGDEAFLAVSYPDNHVALVVRSANVLVRSVVTIDGDGDEKRATATLRGHEPLATALARALLAELR